MNQIIFSKTIPIADEYSPIPASKKIPEWYKNTKTYLDDKKIPLDNGDVLETIKKCMPVFDAFTAGYLILSHTDVWVSQKFDDASQKEIPWYSWRSQEPISFHPIWQAPNHPAANGAPYPKWINPWAIKTPKGYSCLFTQPFHHESVFTALDGIVDTDFYNAPVNFPFVLNDPSFTGLIPAGTPIAQVIPFKRESWLMKIGGEEELKEQNNTTILLRSKFFDAYKTFFRQAKEYK